MTKPNDGVWDGRRVERVLFILPDGRAVVWSHLGFPFYFCGFKWTEPYPGSYQVVGRFERRWWGWKFISNVEGA